MARRRHQAELLCSRVLLARLFGNLFMRGAGFQGHSGRRIRWVFCVGTLAGACARSLSQLLDRRVLSGVAGVAVLVALYSGGSESCNVGTLRKLDLRPILDIFLRRPVLCTFTRLGIWCQLGAVAVWLAGYSASALTRRVCLVDVCTSVLSRVVGYCCEFIGLHIGGPTFYIAKLHHLHALDRRFDRSAFLRSGKAGRGHTAKSTNFISESAGEVCLVNVDVLSEPLHAMWGYVLVDPTG